MHGRSVRRLFALLMVACVMAGVWATAASASDPVELRYACALKANGLVRAASAPSDCIPKRESVVTFSVQQPVNLCVQSDGSVRLIPPRNCAKTKGTSLSVPSNTAAYFCADTSNGGKLRWVADPSQCTSDETTFVVVNHAPTDIALSNPSVAENEPAGTLIGTLSATDIDPGDTFAFSLASGSGSTDNGSFQIDGNRLETAESLDFEDRSSYSVRVRVTDKLGLAYEEAFTITVTDVVESAPPTDIALSNSTVSENQPGGTNVGTLTTTDPDVGETYTYTLVSGSGSTDNASFQISGSTLQTAAPLDFEAGSSRSVRIQTDDGFGGTFEKVFTITVTNANDAPSDITLSNSSVAENQPVGTTVGTLTATDQDAGAISTFTLVAGTGDDDNASFTIGAGTLGTNAVFDFETKDSYTVRVRADDGAGGTFEKALTITIANANDAPTDIVLSDSSVAENQPSGTTVGTLSATDQDVGGGHTFSLVAGVGDDNNASFQITGGTLNTSAVFDHEVKDSYSIRVRVDDGAATHDEVFTITITDVNEAPTDIALSNASVEENQPVGTTVGTFSATDPDAGEAHAFALVSGSGDTDNDSFTIDGLALKTADIFDHETKDSYSIRVRASDSGSLTRDEEFTITVTLENRAPTDIALSNSSVDENQPSATTVGTLSATDSNAGDTHTFALVAGTGADDNGSFTIDGSTLKTNAIFDREVKDSYSIRVRATDSESLTFEEQLTITVTNVNEAPTDIALSNSSVDENEASGTTVGTLSATDPDVGDNHGFALVSGTGDTDNASFTIVGGTLKTSAAFDRETESSYSIRVRATDSGSLTFEKQFTITVTNVNEAPTDIALSNTSVAENEASGTTVGTLSATDPDVGDNHGFALVSGTGDTDNASFTIDGSTLKTSAVFDFETKSSYSIRVRATDSGSLARDEEFTIAVTNVDEPPTAVDDAETVLEDAAAPAVNVLANDTDGDGGQKTISSATDPANGTVVLTGGSAGAHTGLTYQPDPNYCNDPAGTTLDTFTYTLNGGSTATVSMTVTCVDDAPVADDETFNGNDSAHGNTTMQVDDPDDDKPAPSHPHTEITGDILAGDTDVDGPGPLTVTPGTFATNGGGAVTVESDGDFTFHPAPSSSCTDTDGDFFDYTVDSGSPGQTDTGRVTIAFAGCVWYVSNNAAGNSGTSSQPFDTLAQAEAASGANHTVFVFDGDDTSTGYDAGGYAMNAGERLIGEHEGLTVDPDGGGALTADSLHPANAGAHPTLTATNADVIDLDDGNELRGINVDPAGTGGGIAGGSGDTGGGTIDDVNIVDTGTVGTQSGLELVSTTGTFNVSNLVVNNQATGVLLSSAGTVSFAGASSQISITSTGAPGLSASATNMGTSQFDDITVTNSSNGGVNLSNTTGTTTLGDGTGTDLALSTTSGSTPAFGLANGGTVTVGSAGDDNVRATGGPAVDVTGTSGPTLEFDDVDSTSSAGDGINLDGLGAGAFSAASGDITGAAGVGFDLNGGSGAITYPGAFGNGSGTTAIDITGRSGGVVSLSGPISDTSDAGGGINVASNTGGSTLLSGGTKQFNTVTGDAVLFNGSDGHTLVLSGGLDIDTTSGKGLEAITSGTLQVSGSGNTIDTGSGRALNVENTDISSADLTFQRISSNGAPNGIRLVNTGNVSGDFIVAGSGAGTCPTADLTTPAPTSATCTGGVIANSTLSGISLSSVPGSVELTRMAVTGSADHGIAASSVDDFELNRSVVMGNGNTGAESGLDYTNVTGVSSIMNSDILNNNGWNARIVNSGGTLHFTAQNNDFQNTTTEDGLQLISNGTATMRSNVTGNDFDDNKGDAIQYGSTASAPSAVTDATMTSNTIDGKAGTTTDGGIVFGPDGIVRGTVNSNVVKNVSVSAIIINPFGTTAGTTTDVTASNNTIGTAGVQESGSADGDGMQLKSPTDGTARVVMSNNTIRGWQGTGMRLRASESTNGATTHLTAQGNTISDDEAGVADSAIWLQSGSSSTDVVNLCANVGGAAGLANSFTTAPVTAPGGIADFVLDLRFPNAKLRLPGYTGTTATDRQNYFFGRNTGFTAFAQDGIQNPLNEADGACDQPTAPALPTGPTPTS